MTQKAAQTTQTAKPPPAAPLLLQRSAVSNAPVPAVPSVVSDVLRAPGQALDAATRVYTEPRFGHDFSGVRVHADDKTLTLSGRQPAHTAPRPVAHSLLQRQRSGTNQVVQWLVQAKLTVNASGDAFEQEANRVAAQISSQVAPGVQRKCACGGMRSSDGECGTCCAKRLSAQGVSVQRNAAGNLGESAAAPPSVSAALSSGGGRPLDAATRAYMEPRFGHDFRGVRAHTDTTASQSADAIHALAYTSGQDIMFQQGQYAPQTGEGRKLLAHELTHVVQQSNGASGRIQRQPAADQEEKKPVVIDMDKIGQAVMDDLNRLADKEEPEHWYNFRRPLSYRTGPHSLLKTTDYYDTGNSFFNFFTNAYFTVGNLLTLPVNAATETMAIPDEIIEAAGYDPDEFDFVMMMAGIEDFNAPTSRAEPAPKPEPKPPPKPKIEVKPKVEAKPKPEPTIEPKPRKTRRATNEEQQKKLNKQIAQGTPDARLPRIQKNWRNNLREMVKNYKPAVFDVGPDRVLLPKERMDHILRRHHPDCWDGTVAGKQSFFDARMTGDDIADLVRQAINQNQNKIRAGGIEHDTSIEGVVKGYRYKGTVSRGQVAQFFIE